MVARQIEKTVRCVYEHIAATPERAGQRWAGGVGRA